MYINESSAEELQLIIDALSKKTDNDSNLVSQHMSRLEGAILALEAVMNDELGQLIEDLE